MIQSLELVLRDFRELPVVPVALLAAVIFAVTAMIRGNGRALWIIVSTGVVLVSWWGFYVADGFAVGAATLGFPLVVTSAVLAILGFVAMLRPAHKNRKASFPVTGAEPSR